jgi:predicted kinase
MRRLILTVGLPRSGKSTWAKQQGHPVVNPDSIRLALHGHRFFAQAEPFVWAMAYSMVEALFRAGHETVIVDATHVSEKRRAAWFDRVCGPGFPLSVELSLQVIETSPEVCRSRALAEGDHEIIPVIDRMAAEWDLPAPWKGGAR